MIDLAAALIGDRPIEIDGHRHPPRREDPRDPGLRGRGYRTVDRGDYYAILPMLPELRGGDEPPAALTSEYSSADDVMTLEQICATAAPSTTLLLGGRRADRAGRLLR